MHSRRIVSRVGDVVVANARVFAARPRRTVRADARVADKRGDLRLCRNCAEEDSKQSDVCGSIRE